MPMTDVVETDHEGKPFTAKSFLQYLRKSNSIWWEGSSRSGECPWVFRGHRNAAWKLVPSAARCLAKNKLRPIIEELRKLPDEEPLYRRNFTAAQNRQLPGNQSPINRERLLFVEAQRLVLTRFLKLGRELSFLDVNVPPQANALELGYLPIRSGNGKFDEPEVPWAILGQAQHHDVPTFLLDWTEDPVVAGHFAASINSQREPVDLAVWALNFDRAGLACQYNQYNFALSEAHTSPADNPYIRAQRGKLTYINSPEDFFDEKGYYPPLEEVIDLFDPEKILADFGPELRKKQKNGLGYTGISDEHVKRLKTWDHEIPCLRKIVLSVDNVRDFRELLRREGITQAHLMPTLDNASKTAFQLALDATQSKVGK